MRTVPLVDLFAVVRDTHPGVTPPAGDFATYFSAGVARDPSKPFITFYDDDAGERVELSYATFANWVWKSANYLRDGLDVQPGDEVGVLLRTHWQTVVIWYAAWAAGAVVVPLTMESLPGSTMSVLFAPEDQLGALAGSRAQVVGLSLRPMAARLSSTPAGVEDYAIEVPGHGDHFAQGERLALTARALPGRTVGQLLAGAAAAAAHLQLKAGDRLLCTADWLDADSFIATVLSAFDAGSGIVLAPRPDHARLARRCADERVTVQVSETSTE